jgi:hypothetical protein
VMGDAEEDALLRRRRRSEGTIIERGGLVRLVLDEAVIELVGELVGCGVVESDVDWDGRLVSKVLIRRSMPSLA